MNVCSRRGLVAVLCLATAASAAVGQSVSVRFFERGELAIFERPLLPESSAEESAIAGLVAGPTADESARGVATAIPSGTRINEIRFAGPLVTIDLSAEAVAGLDESRLAAMFDQFRSTLGDYEQLSDIHLTCNGSGLSSYLAPVDFKSLAPAPVGPAVTTGVGLAGKKIAFGPSHGRLWSGTSWGWQRSDPCGFGEAVLEDTNSIRLAQFLYQYLSQDGATVYVPRELNESTCCHSATGLPWWKMAARYWCQNIGLPSSVWDSSTTDSNDDIRARPLFADYYQADIYVAHHTNAGGGGTATGTEVYRDTAMEHPAHETASYNLALALKSSIDAAFRAGFDSNWAIRNGGQPRDSAGGFGEIRIPNRPAALIELAFHDNCTRDAAYLTDNYFRSVGEWGVYKGICQYFGNTPTWDMYSYEVVSNTIPSNMNASQSYPVSITLRNRGVLWSEVRSFRLGAAGDSDPFTGTTRHTISGEIRPGSTVTFNFTLTAPSTGGTYTTDWRMVRDGVAWFGPTVSKSVQVGNPPVTALSEPFESYADQAAFEGSWSDTGASEYTLDAAAGNPGKSLLMPSPSANTLGRYYRNLGGDYNGSDSEPLTFQFDFWLDLAGAPNWAGARHYCELRGYSGGSYGAGTLQNLIAIGVYNLSADTWSTTRYQGRVMGGTEWQTLDEAGAPSRQGGWHKLRAEIATTQIRFYVDGVLSETEARPDQNPFNCVVLGSDLTANGFVARVDNIEVLAYVAPPGVSGPTAVNACPGTTANLSVTASGTGPFTYQWQRNSVNVSDNARVSGSATSALQISTLEPGDAGSYRCLVSGPGGTTPSTAAALTVQANTTIGSEPSSVQVAYASQAAFAVGASGAGTLTYEWRLNGVAIADNDDISGSATSSLQIIARPEYAGAYDVVVTGECGSATSVAAQLSLLPVPGDFDEDGDVDQEDYAHMQECFSGTAVVQEDPACLDADFNGDLDVDLDDYGPFEDCFSGPNVPADLECGRG